MGVLVILITVLAITIVGVTYFTIQDKREQAMKL